MLDVAAVILSAPILIPLVIFLACLVRLTSPGPVFYWHRRIRQNGTFFSMWKFRTMCVNSAEVLEEYLSRNPKARAEWSRCHKLRHDPPRQSEISCGATASMERIFLPAR